MVGETTQGARRADLKSGDGGMGGNRAGKRSNLGHGTFWAWGGQKIG